MEISTLIGRIFLTLLMYSSSFLLFAESKYYSQTSAILGGGENPASVWGFIFRIAGAVCLGIGFYLTYSFLRR